MDGDIERALGRPLTATFLAIGVIALLVAGGFSRRRASAD
jgi:hypothetical protein